MKIKKPVKGKLVHCSLPIPATLKFFILLPLHEAVDAQETEAQSSASLSDLSQMADNC